MTSTGVGALSFFLRSGFMLNPLSSGSAETRLPARQQSVPMRILCCFILLLWAASGTAAKECQNRFWAERQGSQLN
jgi:hypothetical protein